MCLSLMICLFKNMCVYTFMCLSLSVYAMCIMTGIELMKKLIKMLRLSPI